MAWTAPRTWVTGEILSSTLLNAQVRDNLLFLFGAAIPTGTILDYGGTAAPTGYLICDGSAISRTTFSDLFGVFSTRFGVGDGSTTFNLPDLRGRATFGFAASGGHADVSTLGANDGAAATARRPKHRHTIASASGTGHTHTVVLPSGTQAGASAGAVNAQTLTTAGDSGGATPTVGNAADTLDAPPYLVVNKMVKT